MSSGIASSVPIAAPPAGRFDEAPHSLDLRAHRAACEGLDGDHQYGVDTTVAVASRHSRVDALGSPTRAVVGTGTAFSNVVIRDPMSSKHRRRPPGDCGAGSC